jgi:hypothetical protein
MIVMNGVQFMFWIHYQVIFLQILNKHKILCKEFQVDWLTLIQLYLYRQLD